MRIVRASVVLPKRVQINPKWLREERFQKRALMDRWIEESGILFQLGPRHYLSRQTLSSLFRLPSPLGVYKESSSFFLKVYNVCNSYLLPSLLS